MKLTKTQLKQMIKEELEDIAGQHPGKYGMYLDILSSIKEILNSHYGEGKYNLATEVRGLAEFFLKGVTPKAQVSEETDKDRMKCNSPRYIKKGEPGYGKKQKVVKACEDGKEKIVRFGDANLEDRSDNPEAKSNFRARHNCDDKKDKLKAGYWSCKEW